jgi:hypothetical protein
LDFGEETVSKETITNTAEHMENLKSPGWWQVLVKFIFFLAGLFV